MCAQGGPHCIASLHAHICTYVMPNVLEVMIFKKYMYIISRGVYSEIRLGANTENGRGGGLFVVLEYICAKNNAIIRYNLAWK